MAEQDQRVHGSQVLLALSDSLVKVFREFLGKGPERCKTYWAGSDMLVILLGGGYTVAEQTLYEAGKGAAVQESRFALQQTLARVMQDTVEDITGREVVAFMSASHQDPDLSAEVFVLKPMETDSPVAH